MPGARRSGKGGDFGWTTGNLQSSSRGGMKYEPSWTLGHGAAQGAAPAHWAPRTVLGTDPACAAVPASSPAMPFHLCPLSTGGPGETLRDTFVVPKDVSPHPTQGGTSSSLPVSTPGSPTGPGTAEPGHVWGLGSPRKLLQEVLLGKHEILEFILAVELH